MPAHQNLPLHGMTDAERVNAGIAPWDGVEVAIGKLNDYRSAGSILPPTTPHTFPPLPAPVYIPSGGYGPVDLRTQYEKDLDSANKQNLVRMAIIFAIVGVLFWVLNASIGQNIRGNSFYGTKDSILFSAKELMSIDYYDSGASPEYVKKWQKDEVQAFVSLYGGLFKPGTPFEKMFEGCKGKYSCTSVSLGAVKSLQRFAAKPGTLFDDMCTVQSGKLIQGSLSEYKGLLDSKFAANDPYPTSECKSVNPSQVKAVAEPLNKRYKLAEAGFLILIPLAAFLLLIFIVPKAALPVKES